MKKLINGSIIAIGLFAAQITQAQGTVYLSNLDQASAGSLAVGSDSWLAKMFYTGNNPGGYALDSIQLAMADATGNPSGFTVSIYIITGPDSFPPIEINLETLNGSANPSTSGIYTYTPASNLTLFPNSPYFIVLTAGTAVADGAYEWSLAGANSYNPSGGWRAWSFFESNNGSAGSWGSASGFPQFALDVTAVPEPSTISLILLGSGALIYVRTRNKKRLG
jgi:hypothetical protein